VVLFDFRVAGKMSGTFEISGKFSEAEARSLAKSLRGPKGRD